MSEQNASNIKQEISVAQKLAAEGRIDEARTVFDYLSQQSIDDLRDVIRMGTIALMLQDNLRAVTWFNRAMELQPDNAQHYVSLAHAHNSMGEFEKGEKLLRRAIEINPDQREAYVRLGIALNQESRFAEAVENLEKAVSMKPTDPEPYEHLINSLRFVDRHNDALDYADKLVKMQPDNPGCLAVKSLILIEEGYADDAIALLEQTIDMDRTFGIAYYMLSGIKKFSADDTKFIEKAERALQRNMPAKQRSSLYFALGKMYNDLKQWDTAFERFRQGNVIAKTVVVPDTYQQRGKRARKVYSKKLLARAHELGSDSDVPVFIVGMPRSGTTLLEQIVASHPDGAGASELNAIKEIDFRLADIDGPLTREMLAEQAEFYLNRLCVTRQDARRIVDKMPFNSIYCGLIYLLFPNARIIHSIRNPLDTCLSGYFQSFMGFHSSNDMQWLGRFYRFYRENMAYWKKVLPESFILDVHYENVINDPQNEVRRIIDFCDLPWNDACLEHHRFAKVIVTSSMWQARQPLYKTSIKRWTNYAPHLEELAREIKDYLDEDDIAEFEKRGIRLGRKFGFGMFGKAG